MAAVQALRRRSGARSGRLDSALYRDGTLAPVNRTGRRFKIAVIPKSVYAGVPGRPPLTGDR